MIPHLSGGILERGERVGVLAVGGLFGVMVPALWVLAIGTTWTAAQRILEARRELERLDRGADGAPTAPTAPTAPGEA